LNASGSAGPQRPVFIVLGVAAVVAVIVIVATSGRTLPPMSRDARLKPIDPLPGGLYSTPEQDALAQEANTAQATVALRRGTSYSPPMAPSQPTVPPPPMAQESTAPAPSPSPPQKLFVGRPTAPRPALPAPLQAPVVPAALVQPQSIPAPHPAVIQVAAVDPKAEQNYANQINAMFARWNGDAPRTDVILPPPSDNPRAGDPPDTDAARGAVPATRGTGPVRNVVSQAPASVADAGLVLIPAGRGVYAHPILALSSDQSSPVVLQADTGPIAGDRMIGSFAKQNDRMVIHVNTIVHDGQEIGVDGLVTSPDTMEAGVASDVDQHYLSRFLLPAAAAFVAGLGQAIEQTSNTAAVISPFGGATTSTHLNIDQQLGVAAGAAASQIGATLNQAAPKGPTISLEANVAVGVIFLSNVTEHAAH
jgi:intracellular multiplication protein IcmE